MNRSRAHHYVPQAYLRQWAENGRVSVRRRASVSGFVASTGKVAQETDLYTVEDSDGPSDFVERMLSRLEGHLPGVLRAIRDGRLPGPGTPGRALFASLLALQFVRTPDRLELHTLPLDALKAAGGEYPVPRESIAALLEARYGYQPDDRELQGACDFINFSLEPTMQLDRAAQLEIMFSSMPKITRYLESKRWSVEISKGRTFVTSDQPLSLWVRQPRSHMGVGLAGAAEIRFPVGPRHLLVLRNGGLEGPIMVRNSRVASVNQHTSATCRQIVIGRPGELTALEDLPLHDKRPMFKVTSGPAFSTDESGGEYIGQVLQLYRPYDDTWTA